MTDAEIVEVMARAIENAPKSKQAASALASLRAAGLVVLSPEALAAAIDDGIDAREREDNIASICDVPGCGKNAGCGWPSMSGYRRTCFAHMDKAAIYEFHASSKDSTDDR